jgi:hypothetical protein
MTSSATPLWMVLVVSEATTVVPVQATAVSEMPLSLMPNGHVRYQLKTPCGDDRTHIIFELPDVTAGLVAVVPKPCAKLLRLHGAVASVG